MHKFFASMYGLFLTPLGLVALGALDATIFVFVPMAVEGAVVILTARHRNFFWLFPLLATAGSLAGSAVTFLIGSRIGDDGLKHWIAEHKLRSFQKKIKNKGALALGSAALLPPPFPMSALILASGALHVRRTPFFVGFGIARLLRFAAIAVLALVYGRWILVFMESTAFQFIVSLFAVVAIVGTVYSIYKVSRSRRAHRRVRA